MANTSRSSFHMDEDNVTASSFNVTASSSRRANKRGRYSYGSTFRPKTKVSQPCLGFQNENLKPTFRGSLHLDERFFPYGIQPGNILEIKGPEKSGKTFLLTYLIVRTLVVYPEKRVLLIDTRHKFNVKNFISILCHFDKSLLNSVGHSQEERREKLSRPLPVLFHDCPEILSYLNRIQVIRCYTPEELMLAFGPPGESTVQKVLLTDESVCLVAVDSIDNYSYSESMEASSWTKQWPNIMHTLKNSVNSTRCPVICTTLTPMGNHVYQIKRAPAQSKVASGNNGSPLTLHRSSNNDSPKPATMNVSGLTKSHSQQKATVESKLTSNFTIDYTVFSNMLELVPVSNKEKNKLTHPNVNKITHCVSAYLRSRQSANTAGSGGNHRVKFSIFSDMLWVL